MTVPSSPGHKSAKQGLDLQGGLEVVLKAIPPKGQKIDSSRMAIAQNIMRNRVDKLGVSEPEVRRQGANQIVIQLAGVHDPRAAASLIGKTAQLEFYDLEADLTGPSKSVSLQGQPVAEPNVYSLLAGQQALVKEKGAGEWYLLDKSSKKVIAGPATTREALFATKAAKKLKLTQRSLQGSSSTRSLQAAPPKAKAKAARRRPSRRTSSSASRRRPPSSRAAPTPSRAPASTRLRRARRGTSSSTTRTTRTARRRSPVRT